MKTKYSMVREYIEQKIMDGTYKPNKKIDSESELMKHFGVSRHTVRLAIGDLATEGWLYREQGSGTFCADRSTIKEEAIRNDVKKIAIITTYISDYIFPSIIRGAEARLSEEGYQVSIFSTNNSYEKEKEILEKILVQHFDGIIVEPTKSAYASPNIIYYLELERLGIPYIMINAYYDTLEPIHLTVDDEKGGFLQAEYLIQHGHNHIAGFYKTDDMQGAKRLKGFLQAHRHYNKQVNPTHIITYDTEEKDTKPLNELERILKETPSSVTAIACYNDELAMELLNVIRNEKLTIPEDISIIGFDNSFFADISEVKLTSVQHPKSKMGKEAANKIMELIQSKKTGKQVKKDSENNAFKFEPILEIRDSVQNIEKHLSNKQVDA